jgi:hypothetical protein
MKLDIFRTVPLSIIIRSFSLYTQQRYMSANLLWHIPSLCVQWKTPDDEQRNCPKHVEFHSKNKFEKLVHLVGFIIRNILISLLPTSGILWTYSCRQIKGSHEDSCFLIDFLISVCVFMHNPGSFELLYNYLITSVILLEGGTSVVKNCGWDFNLTLYSFLGIQVSVQVLNFLFLYAIVIQYTLTGCSQNLVLSKT